MSDRLPEVRNNSLNEVSPAIIRRAGRTRNQAELEVFRYQVASAVQREKDLIDTDTLADVFTAATDAELDFLREFRAKANGSPAAMEIVARKLQMLDDITNRRIARRFGR